MEDTHDPRLELHEPPNELITYPYDRVKALLDNPDDVVAAIEELVEAGFERERIFVLSGPAGPNVSTSPVNTMDCVAVSTALSSSWEM